MRTFYSLLGAITLFLAIGFLAIGLINRYGGFDLRGANAVQVTQIYGELTFHIVVAIAFLLLTLLFERFSREDQ